MSTTEAHGRLRRAIEHAAHLLPSQGPIGVFIHHNTLHAFEHLPFEEAVVAGARIFDAEPFLSAEAFRGELARGRIRVEDIDAVLSEVADAPLLGGRVTRRDLRRLLLLHPLREGDPHAIAWMLHEEGLASRLLPNASPAARDAILHETAAWLGATATRDARRTEARAVASLWTAIAERVGVTRTEAPIVREPTGPARDREAGVP